MAVRSRPRRNTAARWHREGKLWEDGRSQSGRGDERGCRSGGHAALGYTQRCWGRKGALWKVGRAEVYVVAIFERHARAAEGHGLGHALVVVLSRIRAHASEYLQFWAVFARVNRAGRLF
eukprot:1368263-Amorphochlora_amoeboformis.AAC.1